MMKQQVFIYPGSDHVFQALMDDARNTDGVTIVDSLFNDSSIEQKIRSIKNKHHILWRLFEQLILKHYATSVVELPNVMKNSIVVFSNISVRYLSISTLTKLKAKGVKLVLYFIDSISNINAKEAFAYVNKGIFDLVFSFDKKDAIKYGFTHFYTMYSRHYDFPYVEYPDYDGIYVGSDKGRYNILTQFKKHCPNSCLYVSMLNISDKQMRASGFQSNVSISYVDSLKLVQKSNCIIDIVLDPEQSGLSLRAYEAIAFNKKLITNNKSIFEFPFYNPSFMYYFNDIQEINEDFLRKRVKVDYGYRDEYSPVAFIDLIKDMLNTGK